MNYSIIALVAVLILFLVLARWVKPASDRSGTGFRSCSPQQTATRNNAQSGHFSVASFNIQSGKGLNGKRDIAKSAQLISDSDLVGVQEVLGQGWLNRLGLGRSQSEALCRVGNFSYVFSPTRYRWFREQRGNAILSKLSMGQWQMKMLPSVQAKSPRNVTIAEFSFAGKSGVFINTHLHTTRGRETQLQKVLEIFDQYPVAILVGDFNTMPDESILSDWLQQSDAVDAINVAQLDEVENANPSERIDWIITRGFNVHSGEFYPKGISDHPMYQVTLSFQDI